MSKESLLVTLKDKKDWIEKTGIDRVVSFFTSEEYSYLISLVEGDLENGE